MACNRSNPPKLHGLPSAWTALFLILLVGGWGPIEATAPTAATAGHNPSGSQKTRYLAVLNPVDLASGLPDSSVGSLLRIAIAKDPNWKVNLDEIQSRTLRENGIDPDSGCVEFQCGFDAGNALQSEFVLFGTIATLRDAYTYTLNLLHVPTAQIVWSHVGDAPLHTAPLRTAPLFTAPLFTAPLFTAPGQSQDRSGQALQESLVASVADLDPSTLMLRRMPTLGLLAVMDAGMSSSYSRIALQRALSHAYASRAYDLLGPGELRELLGALEIQGQDGNGDGTTDAGKEDMLSMGNRMGVRYLLWTQVDTVDGHYKMVVSLYDVTGKKLIRNWPSRETADFTSLLGLEDRFLTVLGSGMTLADAPAPAPSHPHWKTFGKIASVGLALAAGGAMGYLAFRSKQAANADFQTYQGAQSEQEAKKARKRVLDEDLQARHYGALGGISMALGLVVWAF